LPNGREEDRPSACAVNDREHAMIVIISLLFIVLIIEAN